MDNIDEKEEKLRERLRRVEELEEEVRRREREIKTRENAKKQVLLRLSPSLWREVAAWAEEDFRSINAQIEFLLSEAVRKKKQ